MLFQIGGDASPLNAELDKQTDKSREKGSSAGSNYGKHFGAKFREMFLQFVSGAALVAVVKRTMDEAVRVSADAAREGVGVEAFQELKRLSDEIGMDIKDIREIAPYAAKEFADAMAKIQQNGGIMKEEDVQNLKAAADSIKKLQADMAPGISWLVTAFREIARTMAGFFDWSAWKINKFFGNQDAAEFHKAAFDVYRTDPTAFEELESSAGMQSAGMRFKEKAQFNKEASVLASQMSEMMGFEVTPKQALATWVNVGAADRGVKPGQTDQQMLNELKAIRKALE